MSGPFKEPAQNKTIGGGLLKRLRYLPVAAGGAVQVHAITVEGQVVRPITTAGSSTGRPVETAGTEVGKLTIAVIAQRREKKVFINLTISRLTRFRRSVVVVERNTKILTIGIIKL